MHQTFRLTYLKDVVFPRVLDDQILGTMGTMIFMNSVQLVTHFFTSKLTENLYAVLLPLLLSQRNSNPFLFDWC